MTQVCIAMTGASGALYFTRLVRRLQSRDDLHLHLVISEGARRVLAEETGQKVSDLALDGCVLHAEKNIGAAIASGSFPLTAMTIIPCSMNTLAAIANGLATNLIQRAAAVQLKEGRKLILVPRETPLSLINLRAMCAAKEAGATLLPACPGFYHHPQKIEDLVDTVVDRVLDHMSLPDSNVKRWKW